MGELPLYESSREGKNIWQRYLVFRDRVELRTWFGRFRIALEDIQEIQIAPPLTLQILRGCAKGAMALKLDWADLAEHVELTRKSGLFKLYCFTPSNMQECVDAVSSAKRRYAR